MAWDCPIMIPGLKAGANLSAAANQFKLVELTGDGTVNVCDGATDTVLGVLYNCPESGETADVAWGICKVQGDEDLTAGGIISPSTDGQAATAATTNHPCGVVIVGNAAAGGLATAFILPGISIKA
jgi:hypothetical protein